MIIGGYLSDSSSSTYATDAVDVVDILSDTTSCTPPKLFNSFGPHFLCWMSEVVPLQCDLSQAEKKISVANSWANAQNDIYFTKNGQSCHFVICSACRKDLLFS